jgi:hypothetical protein
MVVVMTPPAAKLDRQRLIRLRESLIDCDIVVDDARLAVDRTVAEFRLAVSARDAIARQLAAHLDETAA